jgi:hypothetical protein
MSFEYTAAATALRAVLEGRRSALPARRAHDVLALLAWMRQHDPKPSSFDVHAESALVPETALALTQVPDGTVEVAQLAATPFRFGGLRDVFDRNLLPGAVKYGDLPALLKRIRARQVKVE